MSKSQELKPCPFCGAGETVIHVNQGTWTGRGYGEPVSVEVRHWCTEEKGQPSRSIIRVGRDESSAIAAWNRRSSASSEQQAAQQDERIVKLEQAYKELSWMFHDQIVAQQAAWIEWHHGAGAEAGMQWIENGLCGPGHIPDEDEPYGKEAQAWYDANNSDPFPVCHCGRPSNMMWMGQGFCCQAHSDAARASNGGKA